MDSKRIIDKSETTLKELGWELDKDSNINSIGEVWIDQKNKRVVTFKHQVIKDDLGPTISIAIIGAANCTNNIIVKSSFMEVPDYQCDPIWLLSSELRAFSDRVDFLISIGK